MRKFLLSILSAMAAGGAFAASPYLSKVYEYVPAPGQFVNTMPEYEEGDTYADILSKTQEAICGARMPGLISLGSYGGYVVVGFDHPVVNVHGRYDFKIYGNAFFADGQTDGSAEPGIVMVSVDANDNGQPDDEWYQLAGSEYHNALTRHNYPVTYFKPADDKTPDPDPEYQAIIDRTYIRYEAGVDKETGYVMRNRFHTQSYWPLWTDAETISFSGTRLPDNATDNDGNYVLHPFKWGYVDNWPNDDFAGLSLDWAVNAQGEPVVLEKADFIMVYTATLQYNGWLGESSTEIAGGEDLHPDAVYSPEWPSDPINPDGPGSVVSTSADTLCWTGIVGDALTVRSASPAELTVYAIDGTPALSRTLLPGDNTISLAGLPEGIYIARAAGSTLKFAK